MFVNCRNLSRFLLVIAGVLFLLLPPQTAGAQDLQLCNDTLADPDARIPACTRLLEPPSKRINLAEVYNHRGAAKVRKGYLDDAIADFTSALNVNPDSCFSGTLFQTMGLPAELSRHDFDGVRRMLGQPMRYYITAGRKEEEVSADSTFATLLLRGLRGEADFSHEGVISAEDLGS